MTTNKRCSYWAQATLEFVFAFIVLMLLFYGVVRAMQWVGVVLGSSQNKHYGVLYSGSANTDLMQNTASQEISMRGFNTLQQLGDSSVSPLPRLKMTYDGQLINP